MAPAPHGTGPMAPPPGGAGPMVPPPAGAGPMAPPNQGTARIGRPPAQGMWRPSRPGAPAPRDPHQQPLRPPQGTPPQGLWQHAERLDLIGRPAAATLTDPGGRPRGVWGPPPQQRWFDDGSDDGHGGHGERR